MNSQVIRTYSKRRPVALFKTESRLVPNVPERISNIRASRLNEKTLVIDDFNDTFDKLLAGTVIPSPKKSPKQKVDQDDRYKSSNDVLFKIPQQTQKTYKRNKKKIDDEKASKASGKRNAAKRKVMNSDSSDEEVNASDDSDKEEKAAKSKGRSKGRAVKKRKLSSVEDNKEAKVKKSVVPLERFNLSMSMDENGVAKRNGDKEDSIQSSNNFSNVPGSNGGTNYLTSTPRVRKARLNVSMHISPIVLYRESQENSSPSSTSKNNTIVGKEGTIESADKNESNNSSSVVMATMLNKTDHDTGRSKRKSVAGNPNNKPLNIYQANGKSLDASPLLFDDTMDCETKTKKNVSVSQDKVKNLTKSIQLSFGDSFDSKKISNDQNNSKRNIHLIQQKFYDSSFIPDDWTNDYNSSYEYAAEKDSHMTENTVQSSNLTKVRSLSSKKIDEKLGSNQVYVLVERLNDDNIKNKQSVVQEAYSEKEMENSTRRKSRRISDINGKNYVADNDNKENNVLNEENPVSLVRNSFPQQNEEVDTTDREPELNFNFLKTKDSMKVTLRRNIKKKKLNKSLEAIAEDFVEPSSRITDETERNEIVETKTKSSNINEHLSDQTSTNDKPENSLVPWKSQPVFLRPGKSWARSLSIINNFHNGQDLEELAIGRGQNWRKSVQLVLNMQPDVIDEDNDRISNGKISYPTVVQNRASVISTSPNRYSRRMSMRIIPSSKRSTLTDDFFSSERPSSIISNARKTSVSRKPSLRIRRDTLIETEEDLIKSAKDIILKRCNQTSYLPFSESFPDAHIDCCRKIGEGVYGEVFLYAKDDEKSVIKIIPIEGDQLVNCEPQKKFHEILSEIIISEELHKLRLGDVHSTNGFVGVHRIMCVIGRYPDKLIDLWKIYDIQKKSENDCPSMFDDDQLYIVLELAHGGQDLEAYQFQNASEAYSIFLQTAYSLAVAEKSLEFEHRDLHWGNLLISKTDETRSTFKLDNDEITLPTKGVKVSVIDFTLSRMSYKGCKIFNDLALDPTLFAAQGEYQFDIYRMMRDSVDNDWQQYNPYTNVLWLDYTLDKMITEARYKKKTTKVHKNAISDMKELRKTILNYKSAFDFVSNCEKIL